MSEGLVEGLARGVGEPLFRAWCEQCSPRAAGVAFAVALIATAATAVTTSADVAVGCGGLSASSGIIWLVARRRDRRDRADAERRKDHYVWPAVGVGRPRERR